MTYPLILKKAFLILYEIYTKEASIPMILTENVLIQIIITAGGILSAAVGYIIWNKKDKRRKEEKEEDYRRELRKEAQEREERQNQDSKNQTNLIIKRLDKMEDKIDNLYEYQSTNAKAISLIFESDMIQFEAFRKSGRRTRQPTGTP